MLAHSRGSCVCFDQACRTRSSADFWSARAFEGICSSTWLPLLVFMARLWRSVSRCCFLVALNSQGIKTVLLWRAFCLWRGQFEQLIRSGGKSQGGIQGSPEIQFSGHAFGGLHLRVSPLGRHFFLVFFDRFRSPTSSSIFPIAQQQDGTASLGSRALPFHHG